MTKTRFSSGRVLHSDMKATVAAPKTHIKPTGAGSMKSSNHGNASHYKKLSAKTHASGTTNNRNTEKRPASAAAKANNSNGKVSANGKAAVKVHAVSKANSSHRKVATVTKTSAGTKASVRVAEQKKTWTAESKKAASSKQIVKAETDAGAFQSKAKMLAKPPFPKATQRKTNPPAHTRAAASTTIAEKFANSIKSISKQSPPFGKSAVSGIAVSTPEKLKTKPSHGYKQVHDSEPTPAVQSFISNLIVKQLKSAARTSAHSESVG